MIYQQLQMPDVRRLERLSGKTQNKIKKKNVAENWSCIYKAVQPTQFSFFG